MQKEYTQTKEQVLEGLRTDRQGLSAQEAEKRLREHGENRLKEAEKLTLFQRFVQQLKDPMLLILLAAAAVSAVTNILSHESFTEVIIILLVVLLNAVLGVVQESKAEAAIEALQTMTAATCKVLRDGQQVTMESRLLVPGDVVLLEAGDAVPADGRILESAIHEDRGGSPHRRECPRQQVYGAPRRGTGVRWATGRTWPTWARRWYTAGAAWWSPPRAWTRRWARSPVCWPRRSRRRRPCSVS